MKLAIVGCGSRHSMFSESVSENYPDRHEIVAMCDNNAHRMNIAAQAAFREGTNGVATYHADAFDAMIAEQKPDTIVVTTPDFLHADYIVRAFESGCDVICEKPMTIDLSSLKQITEAQKRTGRQVRVTFNYRYSPARTQLKQLLASGTIGEITAVDFRWHLDRVHGADYFRRWHRQKENSGGLLVHKATHHFDLLNWWLGSVPTHVTASGKRAFYRPETAVDLGLEGRGPRCATCAVAQKCDFELDMDADAPLRALYREAEHEDGYYRDLCVFDEEIGIEDTMQAHIRFASGATANYTLTAYSPWEGLEIKFQGTKGDLTHRHVEVHGVFGGERAHAGKDAVTTELHLAGHKPEMLDVPKGEGHHGGADPVMLGYIFDPDNMEPDLYDRASDHVAGGWSILTGIAANMSIETGGTVDIQQMLSARGIVLEQGSGHGPELHKTSRGSRNMTKENGIKLGIIGVDHGHIFGMLGNMLAQGCSASHWWSDSDWVLTEKFVETYPNLERATDRRTILDDPDVDMILIAAVPEDRADLAIEAMKAGKDVMVDKPGCTTLEQLERIKATVAETGRIWTINFSERFQVPCAAKAEGLVADGAIGKVVQTLGMGPHKQNLPTRPDWFFERNRYGGILTDIGSHQIDQFLHFTGSTDVDIRHALVDNKSLPSRPGFQDFGETVLQGDKGHSYIRVDWFTPKGLPMWGDGRLTILGEGGYIELRKYIDLANGNKGDQLILANDDGAEVIDCREVPLHYFPRLCADIQDRSETAVSQEHTFRVMDLAIRAQMKAEEANQ